MARLKINTLNFVGAKGLIVESTHMVYNKILGM